MNNLIIAFLLALITERVTEALVLPIKKKYPDVDFWWLLYPSWVLGGALAYMANINLMSDVVPSLDPQVARVLSAVIVGGGANLIHEIFDRPVLTTLTASTPGSGTMTTTVRTDPMADVKVGGLSTADGGLVSTSTETVEGAKGDGNGY